MVRSLLTDAAGVLIFVAIGRNNHDEGTAVGGIVKVAAPFLIALLAGWALGLWLDRGSGPGASGRGVTGLRFGAVVWIVTLAGGMALRHGVFGRGTATPFVIVATLFLALVLLGWRLVLVVRSRRRAGRP